MGSIQITPQARVGKPLSTCCAPYTLTIYLFIIFLSNFITQTIFIHREGGSVNPHRHHHHYKRHQLHGDKDESVDHGVRTEMEHFAFAGQLR